MKKLLVFRIARRRAAGKELSSWLSAGAVLLYAVLILYSFPVWCLGQDVEFDCTDS